MPRLKETSVGNRPFDFDEMIAAIAPRRVHICAPVGDANFRWRSVDAVASAAGTVFNLFRVRGHLSVVHPDCKHLFPREERERAYGLIDQAIGKGAKRVAAHSIHGNEPSNPLP